MNHSSEVRGDAVSEWLQDVSVSAQPLNAAGRITPLSNRQKPMLLKDWDWPEEGGRVIMVYIYLTI